MLLKYDICIDLKIDESKEEQNHSYVNNSEQNYPI